MNSVTPVWQVLLLESREVGGVTLAASQETLMKLEIVGEITHIETIAQGNSVIRDHGFPE